MQNEREDGVRVQIIAHPKLVHHSDSDVEESITSSDSGNTSEDDQHDFATNSHRIKNSYNNDHRPLSSARPEKHVSFADDWGRVLENVRVMTEPSDYPATVPEAVIRRSREEAKASQTNKCEVLSVKEELSNDDEDELYSSKKHASWKIGFTQPASEYVKFRESLEKNKVTLENVMLRNDHCKMLGTIKVANISFEKSVFVRFTSDGWKSYLDRPGIYQSSACKAYDTFEFNIGIPMNDGDVTKIEFCICYVVGGVEYWDSNYGENYSLISETQQTKIVQPQAVSSHQQPNNYCNDAYRMNYDNWTQFASWMVLSTEGPYW